MDHALLGPDFISIIFPRKNEVRGGSEKRIARDGVGSLPTFQKERWLSRGSQSGKQFIDIRVGERVGMDKRE